MGKLRSLMREIGNVVEDFVWFTTGPFVVATQVLLDGVVGRLNRPE